MQGDAREFSKNVGLCGQKREIMRERVTHILYSSDKGYTFSNIYARLRRVLASLGNDAMGRPACFYSAGTSWFCCIKKASLLSLPGSFLILHL